jgi:hypothetical protein
MASRHPQIAQRKQHRQPRRVLGQAPVSDRRLLRSGRWRTELCRDARERAGATGLRDAHQGLIIDEDERITDLNTASVVRSVRRLG